MASYVYGKESRGIGAIAAQDLGGMLSATRVYSTPTKATVPTSFLAREVRGAIAKPWSPRQGVSLSPPKKNVIAGALVAKRRPPIAPAVVGDQETTQRKTVVVIERPGAATVPAGVIEGSPPATAEAIKVKEAAYSAAQSPSGPTIVSAVAKKNAAIDAAVEADRQEAEFVVPTVSTPAVDNTMRNVLLIGGGVALFWLLTRR